VKANPTAGLRLPRGGKRRDRIAPPAEAERLLDALDVRERAIYATAMYAGLRRGELMALRVADVDLDAGLIRIDPDRGSYDPEARVFGPPKSQAAVRTVPIVARLRPLLVAAVGDKPALALVFGRDANTPVRYETVRSHALRAWQRAGLKPIGLHEARHTFASYLIAAGLNAKPLRRSSGIRRSLPRSTSMATCSLATRTRPATGSTHCSAPACRPADFVRTCYTWARHGPEHALQGRF